MMKLIRNGAPLMITADVVSRIAYFLINFDFGQKYLGEVTTVA
jgi:hypothetical protein